MKARMDIWQAGGYSDGSDGMPPAVYTFAAAPGQVLTFSSVTGRWSCGGALISRSKNGPDGTNKGNCFAGPISFAPVGPFSGFDSTDFVSALVGMFLADSLPSSAPATLGFYWANNSLGGIKTNFYSLSPQIGQVFFIGNGLTGRRTGLTQVFNVPQDATNLYLGYVDDCGNGLPGCYIDNYGSLTATFAVASPMVTILDK